MNCKIGALLVAISLLLSLLATGCNQSAKDDATGSVTSQKQTTAESTTVTSGTTEQTTADDTSAPSDSADKTSAKPTTTAAKCKHRAVIDEAKHATFSRPGLTEGSHCSLCGVVLKKQTKIPALGSDLAVGTDYYDRTGKTTYRYSYSFSLYENDRFNLTTLKVGSDKSYELSGEEGSFQYLDHGVYALTFDSGREKMYAKIVDGKFEFCNKDGSDLNDGTDKRPQGTTEVDITPRPGNSVYGYYDLANNTHGKAMQALYYRMYAACEAFVKSDQTVEKQKGNYPIDKINLDSYVLTAEEAVAVWKVFIVENPRYYWLSNTASISNGILAVDIDAAYAKADRRKAIDAAINAMSESCEKKLTKNMSQLEKAMTIHDFVLGQLDYAYKSDGKTPQDKIWAHNLVGSAEKNAGVCEAYAETYQYLCRLNGLDCLIATGFNGEEHAWNVISIDGKWYGVDCTFDETNKKAVSYRCFGMPAARMAEEYSTDSPDNVGIDFLYQLPRLSKQGLELVDLYEDDKLLGVYANIDAAFAAMKNAKAKYEIKLYSYERQGALLLSSASVEHQISSTKTPSVKSLTIRGHHIELGNEYYTRTRLCVNKALTLRSNLTVYDLDVAGGGSLQLSDKKLLCSGTSNDFSVPITGNTDPKKASEIEMAARCSAEFWSPVRVHTFRQEHEDNGRNSTLFRKNTDIVEVHALQFGVFDVEEYITVNVEHLYPKDPDTPVHVSVHGGATVNIGTIHATGGGSCITFTFGKRKEMPKFTLGTFQDSELTVMFYGTTHSVSTDADGNDAEKWTDTVMPAEMKGPLFTLKDTSVYKRLVVSVFDPKKNEYIQSNITPKKFKLNSKKQVVFTP